MRGVRIFKDGDFPPCVTITLLEIFTTGKVTWLPESFPAYLDTIETLKHHDLIKPKQRGWFETTEKGEDYCKRLSQLPVNAS